MRVFTFISKNGDALPIAQRIVSEGHRVVFYINDKDKRSVGYGLIEKSPASGVCVSTLGRIDKAVLGEILHPRPDCVVFDMVAKGFGKVADSLRSKYAVIGGSVWGDRVELDRVYGNQVMKTVGINTPKTHRFTDYKKAIQFVEEDGGTYVYKPSGNQATTTTYVAQGAEDMIGMLEYYSGIDEEFELQEKVSGVEVSTELWFTGKMVVNVNHTFEEKRLMEGGLGPQAGCMGSVVIGGNEKSRLYKEGIGRVVSALKKVGYGGPIDLNTIVTESKLYGLEFTARFGYNALFVLMEMMKGRINDFLYGVASGVLKESRMMSEWGIGIDVCVPPYPLDVEPELYKGVLIQGLNEHNLRHIWFYDVMKDGKYMCSGNGGDIGTVTARGDEIGNWSPLRDARRRALRTISNLVIPDVMYRRDIGERVPEDYRKLRRWGWIA